MDENKINGGIASRPRDTQGSCVSEMRTNNRQMKEEERKLDAQTHTYTGALNPTLERTG